MATLPLFKGEVIRFTRVNSCGLPIEGPGNRVITNSFVSVGLEAVMKERGEVEQENANGEICFTSTTAPVRKRYTATVTMCDVNTCLISKVAGWSQYLDYAGNAIGFDDAEKVDSDFGVAIEVWTGAISDAAACAVPSNDDVFTSAAASAATRGYLLFFAKEFQVSGLSISNAISNPVLTGITFPGYQWSRGPYNVQEIDAAGTAGRMLTPIPTGNGVNSQVRMFRTIVPPPEPQDDCCFLGVQSIFTAPDYYFGGPASEPAAAIAPAQPACDFVCSNEIQSVTFSGDTTLIFDGEATSTLTTASTAAQVEAALEASTNIGVGNVTVTGTAPGPFAVEFVNELAGVNQPTMTAGTPANATIAATQEGGDCSPS